MRCPHCQTENPQVAQRCSSCGATLNDQPNAERKLVTVLYADLVGHTEIETRTDPEEWQALLKAYFAEMRKPIERYGGTVEKFIGDAIFAVFGVPRTHEDDAERAVRAAEEMQAALGRLNPLFARRLGTPLGLRIALVTDEAVAPREPGEDQLVTGDLTSFAERLQKEAPSNGIVLSDRTYHLVAPLVDVESLDSLTLKGFPTPQHAFLLRRVRREGQRPWDLEVSAPLIGRKEELAALMTAGDRLIAGQGQVVVIIGEAGLGKSRLVAELRARLRPHVPFVEALCHEFAQTTAYGAVVQHLRAYLELTEADPAEIGRVQLGAALFRAFGKTVPEIQQALEHLLELESSHHFEELTRSLGPDDVRTLIVRAITALWEALATKSSLALVVEDLQWVDTASAGVLGEILRMTERVPVMLLCTFRPERRSLAWEFKVAAERDHHHRYRELRLEPLAAEETEQLASVLLEKFGLPTELKARVAGRAEGNPFYVGEVVKSLLRQEARPTMPSLPDTLRGILLARLDRLPPPTRKLLQTASVIGRTFPLRVLRAVSGTDGDLASHLSVLQRTDFVYEEHRLPEPQFAFRHVLLQEAAYHTLIRPERREFHRRVAEVLERESPADHTLPIIVQHFLQGEVWDKAFDYAVKAGDATRAISALVDALKHYDLALRIAHDHPKDVADASLFLHLQLARGDILSFLGNYAAAQQQFEDLLRHARIPKVRAQVYRGIGRLHSLKGDLQKAKINLEKALQLFKKARHPGEEARAYRDLAHVMERRRDYAKALKYARQGLAIAEEHALQGQVRDIYHVLTTIHLFGGDVEEAIRYGREALLLASKEQSRLEIVQSHNDLAYVLLIGKGLVKEAIHHAQEAVALATELTLAVPLVSAQDTLGWIFLAQGRWPEAANLFRSVDELVRRHLLGTRWQAVVLRGYAFVSLAQGLWHDAVRRLDEARAMDQKSGIVRSLPRIHRGLAEAYLGLRNFSQARAHASKVGFYELGGNAFETPAALRALAGIAREQGHLKRAVRLLEASQTLLEPRKGSSEYALGLLELARTWLVAGQIARAGEAVEQSMSILAALDAMPLLEEARQLARQFKGG